MSTTNKCLQETFEFSPEDAKFMEMAINFDDSFIYDQLELNYDQRSIKCEHFMRSDALRAFRKWDEKEDKVEY